MNERNTANNTVKVLQSEIKADLEIVQQLQQTLEKHRGERQIVVIQDFPDPDALASAWTYQLIAQQYKIDTDIVYAGVLSHQENITLVKLTNLPAKRWDPQNLKSLDFCGYQGCVLVDSQGNTSQLTPFIQEAEIPIVVLVDHHSDQGNIQAEFSDRRPHINATATIFTQYLQQGLLTLNKLNQKHVKCATALMHGIRTDTNQLLQAQEEDFLAMAYLSNYHDPQLFKAIMQSARSRRVMDVIEKALTNRQVKNNFSFAGVGYLRYEDRDAIPQAADFLVTEENVHTSVVYGIVHDEQESVELVIGSLRTNKLTLDPDEFIKQALGKDTKGRYFGGGRYSAGGFEIPIGFLGGFNDHSDYTRLKWEVFDLQIQQKLLRLVNPDEGIINTD
ncbi:bifunctional oligoribonuclease/PAP phosphatase NrnA [Gloeocapsa sp. PCC 73106]|uniref:DHH family phosphoesterase n=1 Tax=Gloeocapsa sp. PCC 73106 TaxID=102232 RepID=UPI0002AC72B5|nr:bifunctional oligoribonuclease/PAP phosphatase NrnA [Gloeocapsa sp. PCC 73106]ELR99669.1 exopolyphosphatase-like enzyme [Gloeocapsa sp. PCC 73106]